MSASRPEAGSALPLRRIERNGVTLTYRVLGAGQPVLLAHPLTQDGTVFIQTGIASELAADGWMCVIPDALGHGGSDVPAERSRYSLTERVVHTLAVLDELEISRCHLIGYSMGAWLVSGMVATHPHRCRLAVLAGWDPLEGARLFTRHSEWSARQAEFEALAHTLVAHDFKLLDAARLNAWVSCYSQLFGPLPTVQELAAAKVPIEIACGARDPYLPNCREAADRLPAAFHELPGNHISAFAKPEFLEVIRIALGRSN